MLELTNQCCVKSIQQFNLILQQNNMHKTMRATSLPHLKYTRHEMMIRKSTVGTPKPQKTSRNEQVIEMGCYVINKQQLLGRGFCSSVYKGKNTKTGETVAIKVVQFDKLKGAVQKRLIKNEMKNLHMLKSSKNILRLHEIITNKDEMAFVTEICKESLLQRLKSKNASKKQPLPREEAYKILKEILRGYYEMREHGLLHRDIKPANILIGQDGQARLGDLGFSIRDDQVQQDRHVNLGSPLYMAPEVLKGNQYSSKADMWSVGLIFLEMLIGDLPWASIKQSNLHAKLLELNMKQIVPSDISEKHSEMLLKCLQIDPRKRIGVRQMMSYLFRKEELEELTKIPKETLSCRSSIDKAPASIPTNISENQEQKNKSTQANHPLFQRRKMTIGNFYATNLSNFSYNSLNRSSKLLSSRKNRVKCDNKDKVPLILKLKINGPEQQQVSIIKQQMSQLHLCRFLFKTVQLICKGEHNIHNTYFCLNQKISVEMAQFILYTLQQIRLIKSGFSAALVHQFRNSKQFKKILELTMQYKNNYIQFFQIQLKTKIEGKFIEPDYLIDSLTTCIKNGREHFELILEEVEKSELKAISDDQICQYTHLIDFMAKLVHLMRLKKKGRQSFVKFGKVQELANTSLTSITIHELRKIAQRLKI